MVAARAGRLVLRRSPAQPGLRVGVRESVHGRDGVRVPGDLPGVLPHGAAGPRGRRPAPDLPRHPLQAACIVVTSPIAGRLSDRPGDARCSSRWPLSSTGRAAARRGRRATSTATWSAWRSAASGSACTWPSTSPSSSTCFPQRLRRQGPRRPQHRRRAPVRDRARRRAGRARAGRRQLSILYAVAAAAPSPVPSPSCRSERSDRRGAHGATARRTASVTGTRWHRRAGTSGRWHDAAAVRLPSARADDHGPRGPRACLRGGAGSQGRRAARPGSPGSKGWWCAAPR